jgi:glycerol kinase
MKKYILTFDQGTSSSRAVLFDENAAIVGISQKETRQILPKPGWVEQSPDEIWNNQYDAAISVLKDNHFSASDVLAIGITNQRETTLVWDKISGKPVYNAIIWQDKRTAEFCSKLKDKGWSDYIQQTTGLIIDPYFSATKLNWILDNVENARDKAEKGELIFGTIDTFLVWKLTGGLHITDHSNASRTMLFDINKCCWDRKLLELFHIPLSMLPEVVESSAIYGTTIPYLFNGCPIPVASLIGDQQSALFGQLAHEAGTAKNTYGTGCFLLMNTSEKLIFSKNGLLTTIAWKINGKLEYALEGSIFIAGAVMKWLRDNLNLIDDVQKSEAIALEANDNNGIYFVPAFSGLGAPYWDSQVKGIISGLTLSATKNHIIRAALESMAYQTKDVLDIMHHDSGIILKELNVDGGASSNNFLMQFQSDLLNVNVNRPEMIESTALGAALLAGLAVGAWSKELFDHLKLNCNVFKPSMSKTRVINYYNGWQKAVRRARC